MIIGVDGYAGAGKDTVADIFVKMGFTKVAFADALREAASHSFKIRMDYFVDRELKDKEFEIPLVLNPKDICEFCTYLGFEPKCDEAVLKFQYTEITSPRHLLQFAGTEIGRETLSQTIWTDIYRRKLKDLDNVVTPDARFSNERLLIKAYGGKLFWIDRPGLEPSEKHKSGTDKWPIDKYDVAVRNDKTIAKIQHELGIWWAIKGDPNW